MFYEWGPGNYHGWPKWSSLAQTKLPFFQPRRIIIPRELQIYPSIHQKYFSVIYFQVIQNNGPELVIESATFSDTGKYICMVRNNIWLKLVDVWVTVKRTTTSTIITTTTEPPTTTTSSTTTTAGLQICMCVVYYI